MNLCSEYFKNIIASIVDAIEMFTFQRGGRTKSLVFQGDSEQFGHYQADYEKGS